jgi:hypothetical protein
MDKSLHQAMQDRLKDGKLPCSHAMAVAQELNIDPETVGLAANEADIRISGCQLGLFGFGPKAEGKHKIVKPMDQVPEHLAARLRDQVDGDRITCAAVWQVADGLGIRRIEASSAVEAMGLSVSHCQLACFPRPWEPPKAKYEEPVG